MLKRIALAAGFIVLVSGLITGSFLLVEYPGGEEGDIVSPTMPPQDGDQLAREEESKAWKSETVYVLLDHCGEVLEQRIVNRIYGCEDTDAAVVADYGSYLSVSNLTSGAELAVLPDRVLFDSCLLEEGAVYYEGIVDKELPVDFSITYYLDGKRVNPDALAGAGGLLEIVIGLRNKMKVREPVEYIDYYGDPVAREDVNYVPLLVQGSIAADLEIFSQIETEDGMSIIIGQEANINFMAFPYPEDEIVISMYGESIELEGFAFTVLPQLSPVAGVNMEDEMASLLEGIQEIGRGLGGLYVGSDEILRGLEYLSREVNLVMQEVEVLQAYLDKFSGLLELLKDEELEYKIEQLAGQIDDLIAFLEELPPPEFSEKEMHFVGRSPVDLSLERHSIDQYDEVLERILDDLYTLREIFVGFSLAEGIDSMNQLEEMIEEMSQLPGVLEEMVEGQRQIRDGIGELKREGVGGMEEGLVEAINEIRYGEAKMEKMKSLADGYRSHADNSNNLESSVQFILQTGKIDQVRVDDNSGSEKETGQPGWFQSLWQKFVALFAGFSF